MHSVKLNSELFNQDVSILENQSMRGQMTKIEELKEKAKVGWASFISFEALTSTAAPKLVKFSGARQGMKLLDVACGTGVVALTASRLGVEVEGIDLTPELINRAIENSKIMGLKAKFVEGDAEFLPYKENDFVNEGSFKIQKLSKIQSLGAKNLHESWITIPHVTHFEEADLAAINKLRKSKKSSVLAYFVHALCHILKEFPSFNSSLVDGDNLLLKEYINIGIAVDTEMGLVVPVIKDADKLSVENISKKIEELAGKARERKLFEKDLTGATFTVSSLGKIGGIGFTPIINPPEVGIISISRSRNDIELQNGEVKEKVILPFGLSYDHRVINGADAGRFSLALKEKLESLS